MSYLYNNWFWSLIFLVLITIIIILLIKTLKDNKNKKKKYIKPKVKQINNSLEKSEFNSDRSFYYKIADKLDSLYVSTVKYFRTDKFYIIEILKKRYNEKMKNEVGILEYNSWLNNLGTISNLIEEANIHESTLIIFEWDVLYNIKNIDKIKSRIDVSFLGLDSKNNRNILTLELKNWSPNSKTLESSLKSDKKDIKHPFYQLKSNYFGVQEKLKKIDIKEIHNIYSCVYMPNYMIFKTKKQETYVNDFLFKVEEYKLLEDFLKENKNAHFFINNNKYELIKKLEKLFSKKFTWITSL